MPDTAAASTMEILLDEDDWARHLADQTLAGLQDSPPHTPPVWFYDAIGSDLFDRITRLAEYYPTRAERAILTDHADEIADLARATSLIELGAGSADKTRTLLAAMARSGALERFVPVDVSLAALEVAADQVNREFADLPVHGIVADFHTHMPHLPKDPRRMIAFLGSTIGNMTGPERHRFLTDVAGHLGPEGTLLIGTDLVKPADVLQAAYNDPGGVTAAFNRNALVVINRRLGADFAPDAYDHSAVWVPQHSRIEMRLVAGAEQVVTFAGLGGHRLRFSAGEWLRTEISVKFPREQVRAELTAAGMTALGSWTDAQGRFMVTLAATSGPT